MVGTANFKIFFKVTGFKYTFTLYMIASEKAALSLVCSVTGGVLNMILDYVLIAAFNALTKIRKVKSSFASSVFFSPIFFIITALPPVASGL